MPPQASCDRCSIGKQDICHAFKSRLALLQAPPIILCSNTHSCRDRGSRWTSRCVSFLCSGSYSQVQNLTRIGSHHGSKTAKVGHTIQLRWSYYFYMWFNHSLLDYEGTIVDLWPIDANSGQHQHLVTNWSVSKRHRFFGETANMPFSQSRCSVVLNIRVEGRRV